MLNLKKYIPFGLAIIIILLILAGYFFVYPEYQDYTLKKKELDTKDTEITAKEEYLPKLEVVAERLSEYADQVSIIETALPFEPSIAALSNYFQKTVSQNGLILENLDVSQLFIESKSESSENIKEMLFSATAIGSYESFKNLLLDIYLNARMIEVSSFNLSSADQEDELLLNNLLSYKINLKTQSYSASVNPINPMDPVDPME